MAMGIKEPPDDDDKEVTLHTKDKWDKASILFRPLASIITAITIVLLGYFTSSFLEKQKEKENDVRLYTQLMSEREKAEQSLRTTMFKEIFDRVLTRPADGNATAGIVDDDHHLRQELRVIKTHVVGIDMISRNFHEFLDMKPLFLHVMWEIIVQRGNIKKQMGEDDYRKECLSVGESWTEAKPCQELMWQQRQLVGIARRVINKQFAILAENGNPLPIEIPLHTVCDDKNLRTLKDSDECKNSGFAIEKDLELAFGECTRKATFKIAIHRTYTQWNMVRVDIETSVKNEGKCSDAFQPVAPIKKTFWVGSFDFPMVDHTYISAHEKYAVIMDKIDRSKRLAKIQLVYFPASDAGLQEKAYYQQKLLERLINQSELFPNSMK